MNDVKIYTIFVPEDDLEKFLKQEGEILNETLIDEETREQFQAKVVVSRTGGKDFHNLHLQGRGAFLSGEWFVKVIETDEEEDEGFTIFESKRYGQRRGYMLRSMMAEGDKAAEKKETMTTELQKRLKQRQKLVEELLKKEK
jgi:ABC-type phosphate transport system auxiliary subunit